MSALLEKERRREAELELELARLQHANQLDEMLELQVTDSDSTCSHCCSRWRVSWMFSSLVVLCCLLFFSGTVQI